MRADHDQAQRDVVGESVGHRLGRVAPGLEAVPRTYAFAPDGHTLVTGYFGGDRRTARIGVRDLAPEAVVSSLCATAGIAISAEEWRRVIGGEPPEEPGCR